MTANTMGNRVSVPIPMLILMVPTESQTNASTTAAA